MMLNLINMALARNEDIQPTAAAGNSSRSCHTSTRSEADDLAENGGKFAVESADWNIIKVERAPRNSEVGSLFSHFNAPIKV